MTAPGSEPAGCLRPRGSGHSRSAAFRSSGRMSWSLFGTPAAADMRASGQERPRGAAARRAALLRREQRELTGCCLRLTPGHLPQAARVGLRRAKSRKNGVDTHSSTAKPSRPAGCRGTSSMVCVAMPHWTAVCLNAASVLAWISKASSGSPRTKKPSACRLLARRPSQARERSARRSRVAPGLFQQPVEACPSTGRASMRMRSRRQVAGSSCMMIQPPGRTSRAIARRASTGSAWCMRNSRVKARSNGPPSATGSR